MLVEKRGPYYRVVRITGPRHNLLELRLTRPDAEIVTPPTIEALPPVGSSQHAPLDPERVLRAVIESVEEANRVHGTSLQVARVPYVCNDTPPEESYGVMAYEVVARIARGAV